MHINTQPLQASSMTGCIALFVASLLAVTCSAQHHNQHQKQNHNQNQVQFKNLNQNQNLNLDQSQLHNQIRSQTNNFNPLKQNSLTDFYPNPNQNSAVRQQSAPQLTDNSKFNSNSLKSSINYLHFRQPHADVHFAPLNQQATSQLQFVSKPANVPRQHQTRNLAELYSTPRQFQVQNANIEQALIAQHLANFEALSVASKFMAAPRDARLLASQPASINSLPVVSSEKLQVVESKVTQKKFSGGEQSGEQRSNENQMSASIDEHNVDQKENQNNDNNQNNDINPTTNNDQQDKSIEPRQRRRMFNRILKKAEWNHLFVELSKVFLRYFLDLALKDIINKQGGERASGDSSTSGRKKLDAQSELADVFKEFVKAAISNMWQIKSTHKTHSIHTNSQQQTNIERHFVCNSLQFELCIIIFECCDKVQIV